MKTYRTQSLELVVRPDNIIEATVPADWNQPDTVETTRENALLLQKVIKGNRYAILTTVPSIHMNREIIEVYNEIETGQIADALIVDSFGARVLGNLALKVIKLNRPMRLFTDRAKAESWLLDILAEKNSSF